MASKSWFDRILSFFGRSSDKDPGVQSAATEAAEHASRARTRAEFAEGLAQRADTQTVWDAADTAQYAADAATRAAAEAEGDIDADRAVYLAQYAANQARFADAAADLADAKASAREAAGARDVSFFADKSELAQRLTMSVLGIGTVIAIGFLARELAGDRSGLIAAGIAAVYPYLWVNDGLIMSETLAALMVSLALLYAFRLLRAPSLGLAVLVGGLCGLAGLARAELLLLVPFLAVPATLLAKSVAGRERWQLAGVSVLAAAVLVVPWVAFNLARFDEPTYISTNDGIALLGSNCRSVYFGDGIGLTDLSCLGANPRGDQSVDSEIYRDRAFDFMSEHKGRVPIVALARVGRTWSVFRPWDMVDYNVGEGREKWLTATGLFFYYPLLALAIGGVVVLWRRKATLWPLFVPPVVVALASAATYGQTRFRVPAEPSLIVLAAIALAALVAAWGERRARPQPAPLPQPQ